VKQRSTRGGKYNLKEDKTNNGERNLGPGEGGEKLLKKQLDKKEKKKKRTEKRILTSRGKVKVWKGEDMGGKE